MRGVRFGVGGQGVGVWGLHGGQVSGLARSLKLAQHLAFRTRPRAYCRNSWRDQTHPVAVDGQA